MQANRLQPFSCLFIILIQFASSSVGFAEEGLLRIGADVGLGSATVSVSGSKRIEQPGTFAVLFDYALSSLYTVGVEHFRTLVDDKGPSSGVGFTGAFGKYYFYSARPQILPANDYFVTDEIIVHGLSPYIGASVGIGQASLRSLDASQAGNRSLSVGAYVGARVGLEYPFIKNLTLFAEGNVSSTIAGTGTIFFPRASVGFLYSM